MLHKVRVVRSDDWCALYIDGKKQYENHSISVGDFFNIVKLKCEKTIIDDIEYLEAYCNPNWLEEIGNFPTDLSDVVFF